MFDKVSPVRFFLLILTPACTNCLAVVVKWECLTGGTMDQTSMHGPERTFMQLHCHANRIRLASSGIQ